MRKSKSLRKSRKSQKSRNVGRRRRSTTKRTGGGLWDSIKNAFSSTDTTNATEVMNNESSLPPIETETIVPSSVAEPVVSGGRRKRRTSVRK